jgi:hypothetical protein
LFEINTGSAFDAKSFGNISFRRFFWVRADPFENVRLSGKFSHEIPIACSCDILNPWIVLKTI